MTPTATGSSPLVLRDAAVQAKRHVGVALTTLHFDEPAYVRLAGQHFNSLTPENQMKWDTVEPAPGQFAFEPADTLVQFATDHGMRVRGHTLVWHNQLAPWVGGLTGANLHRAMVEHITATVEHFKGKVAQWDVVNEALDASGELRANSPFTALGRGYIADAFRTAHAADPEAVLFYNDYAIEGEGSPKTEAAYALVAELKDDGVPVHGIGFQMHVDPRNWPSSDSMGRTFARFARLGLRIEVTELDIPLGEIPGNLDQKLARQAVLGRDIVSICLREPACTGITFWGLTDRHSWLNIPRYAAERGRSPHLPLPFSADYEPKPVYSAVLQAFLAGQ